MRRKILAGASVAALLVFFGTGTAFAATRQQAAQAQQEQPQDWKDVAAQKAQDALSSREWTVYVWQAETKGTISPETDVLSFSAGKLTSRNFAAQGYPESNYGLFIGDDGSVSWETMQAKETPNQVDLVFIRGSLSADNVLSGSMVMQPQKGAKKKFIYSTLMPDAQAQAAAQKTTTTTKKSRR